jgi:LDH2 family malate/lactate/ureidoglycolate dehydrogenase
VLVAAGMTQQHAHWSGEAMVWADLHGRPAHGVGGKLPQCVARIHAGGTVARASVQVVRDLGAAVSLDAGHAWGQVAGTVAMRHAIERAREHGVGLASVRHSSSAAAIGYYAWMATQSDMVGVALTNGPALIAAPGGQARVVGNQGHAIACPGGDGGPVVYDAATTTMSTGTMDLFWERGESLPEGVLRNRHGQPSVDPADWTTGLLEPIGGHRGFGLSVAFELLTGILAGGERFGAEVGLPGDAAHHQSVSMLCLAVNPAVGVPLDVFRSRLEAYRKVVHGSGTSEGRKPRLPGERAVSQARRSQIAGITLPPEKVGELAALARSLGVPEL